MTIGFFGEPSRPIVEAMGMPSSMCVAWMSPFESESRMAAQLAPFTTVELMPYFLKSPFSCATTIGEQSVSAIIPNRRSGVSGPSLADQRPAAAALLLGFGSSTFFFRYMREASAAAPIARAVACEKLAPPCALTGLTYCLGSLGYGWLHGTLPLGGECSRGVGRVALGGYDCKRALPTSQRGLTGGLKGGEIGVQG